MDNPRDADLAASDLPEIARKIRVRTPARLLVGRAGAAYRTSTQLDLGEAHAAARDAVRAELDANRLSATTSSTPGTSSKSPPTLSSKTIIFCAPS